MNPLSDIEDFAHVPNDNPAWRESYYFNWVDLRRRISGFTTIGLLPNAEKREFVFAIFYDDKRELFWNEPEGEIPTDFDESLSHDSLSFELVEPMKEWNIGFRGNNLEIHMNWKQRFPPYDFGHGSGTSWSGHFEQSGIVEGVIQLPSGPVLAFKGYGERDKSWGVRDWHIESWYAFHAQFDSISFGLRRDSVKGKSYSSGGISTKDSHTSIVEVDVETEYMDPSNKIPYGATTTVYGEDGSKYTFKSKTLTSTSFVRFEREFPVGKTELFENMAQHHCEELDEEGTGLLEWLFTHKK